MLGLIECLIAISATITTCIFVGRLAALMFTAVAAVTAAVIMPPFLSWQVESTTDQLALLFQTVVGLAVTYAWPPVVKRKRRPAVSVSAESRKSITGETYFLPTIARSIMERERDLAERISDIEVYGELDARTAISQDQLKQVLLHVLRIAFSDPKVQHVNVYTSRKPALDQISVVAEYDRPPSIPHFRLIGRSDSEHPLQISDWPANCSVTHIDNGFEHTYHVSIHKFCTVTR